MAMFRSKNIETLDLTDEDVDKIADFEARKYLGKSRSEFIADVESGNIPKHPIVGHLLLLTRAGTAC